MGTTKNITINKISIITSLALFLLGLPLAAGGMYLAFLGGSYYYLLTGIILILTSVLAWQRRLLAVWLYMALTFGTILWAVIEVGFDCWALLPRVSILAVLSLWFALPVVRRSLSLGAQPFGNCGDKIVRYIGPILFILTILLCSIGYINTSFKVSTQNLTLSKTKPINLDDKSWPLFGNSERGDRFSPADQITPENVKDLELAWHFRSNIRETLNVPAEKPLGFQVTPIKVDDSLYLCTPYNIVISLNADTGEEQWRYDPSVSATLGGGPCRGVSHYSGSGSNEFCDQRLFMSATDNRLLALDLKTGKLCPSFGVKGTVDLTTGMGENLPGYQFATSPPMIVGDTVILGNSHADNQTTDEPPGVIRSYDARSGKLLWAWEVLEPTSQKNLNDNTLFARNTPNAWSIFSADSALGLVYIPTGNTPPDFYGGQRTPEQDRYPSSIVALDVKTGDVRWSFQTVHHDLWDLDVASQPVLVDIDTPNGRRAALLAPTKRGDIFALDRLTGKPLFPITETPVPQHPAPGERLSATQPYQPDFPSFSPPDLTESDMWGATMLDQMMCRIKFHQYRYDGQFTPPSLQGSITYPSFAGVINWGSVAVDPERQLMLVNSSWMPFLSILVPRVTADALGIRPMGETNDWTPHGSATSWWWAQADTPYAAISEPFLSPVGFPCHQPPWGALTAVDLNTNKILWQQPFGTTRNVAPMNLALPMGVFNHGGAVLTRSGLAFIGAAIDSYFRAYDIVSGEELWKAKLPTSAHANPMTYVSNQTGRQYVVIAVGGHVAMGSKEGDYLMAYALPEEE